MQSGMPYFWQIRDTSRRLAMETGCPPAELFGQGHDHQPHVFRALFQDGLLMSAVSMFP